MGDLFLSHSYKILVFLPKSLFSIIVILICLTLSLITLVGNNFSSFPLHCTALQQRCHITFPRHTGEMHLAYPSAYPSGTSEILLKTKLILKPLSYFLCHPLEQVPLMIAKFEMCPGYPELKKKIWITFYVADINTASCITRNVSVNMQQPHSTCEVCGLDKCRYNSCALLTLSQGFFGGEKIQNRIWDLDLMDFHFSKKTLNPKMDLLFVVTVMLFFLHCWSVLSYAIQCGYFCCAVFFFGRAL